jgi:tetratricopeptide (TPR) repeat protein
MLNKRWTNKQEKISRTQMQARDARKGMRALGFIISFFLLGLGMLVFYMRGQVSGEFISTLGTIFALVSGCIGFVNKKPIRVFFRSLTSKKVNFWISYHIVDYRWATWISSQFEAAGYSAFIREWDGEEAFVQVKRTALKEARCVVTVLSPDYLDLFGTDNRELAHFLGLHENGSEGLLINVRTFLPEPRVAAKIRLDLVRKGEDQARNLLVELANEHGRRDISGSVRSPVPDEARYPGNLPEVWNVPTRNPFFTGREGILSELHKTFLQNRASQPLRPRAITGMGGLGKTQVAIEYAYLYHQDYTSVLWLHMPPHLRYDDDLKRLAKLLKVPDEASHSPIEEVKNWLREHSNWLLVLDQYCGQQELENVLPESPRGCVLLTTSADFLDKTAQQIQIGEMDEREGALFLLRRAEIIKPDEPLLAASRENRRIAAEIVQEMGGFPQALDYAGAYMRKVKCPLAEYLRLYQTRHLELMKFCLLHLSEHEQAQPEAAAGARPSEIYTWVISYKEIERKVPAAAQLLALCSFLNPEAIPVEILRKAPDLEPALQAAAGDPLQLNRLLMELLRFSLLDRDRETDTLSLNHIVQVYLKDQMDPITRQRLTRQAVRAVGQAFPPVGLHNIQVCEQQYAPQAQVCLDLLTQWPQEYPNGSVPASSDLVQLYLRFGSYLRERALWSKAKQVLAQALCLGTGTLGVQAACTYQLAELCYHCAEYAEAERFYQTACALFKQLPAADSSVDLARALIGLANLDTDYRRTTEAQERYTEAVAILEQARGAMSQYEAAVNVDILDYLAGAYERLGRVAEAGALLEQALETATTAWGSDQDNQRIIFLQTNLVRYHFARGTRDAEGYGRYRRAVRLCEQALGAAHPQVRLRIVNLAGICELMGDAKEAEQLYERASCLYDEGPSSNLRDADAKMSYARFLRQEARQARPAEATRKRTRAAELESKARTIYTHYGLSISEQA